MIVPYNLLPGCHSAFSILQISILKHLLRISRISVALLLTHWYTLHFLSKYDTLIWRARLAGLLERLQNRLLKEPCQTVLLSPALVQKPRETWWPTTLDQLFRDSRSWRESEETQNRSSTRLSRCSVSPYAFAPTPALHLLAASGCKRLGNGESRRRGG